MDRVYLAQQMDKWRVGRLLGGRLQTGKLHKTCGTS